MPPHRPSITLLGSNRVHFSLNISIALAGLLNHHHIAIGHFHLRLSTHTNRHSAINPFRNQETAHSPHPHQDTQAHSNEQGRYEDEKRDTDPEQRKDSCADYGDEDGAGDEGEEEEDWCQREEELNGEECLFGKVISFLSNRPYQLNTKKKVLTARSGFSVAKSLTLL